MHIENSLSGIQLQRVGKFPINSIHGLCQNGGRTTVQTIQMMTFALHLYHVTCAPHRLGMKEQPSFQVTSNSPVESSEVILQILFVANIIILEHYVTLEESMCLLPDFETPLYGGSFPINGPQQRSL